MFSVLGTISVTKIGEGSPTACNGAGSAPFTSGVASAVKLPPAAIITDNPMAAAFVSFLCLMIFLLFTT